MIRERILGIAGLILVLVLWALGACLLGEHILPAPWTSFYDAWNLLSQPSYGQQILITLWRIVAGFGLAMAAGIVVGLLMGIKAELSVFVKPFVLIVQGVPPLLWAIPLVIILRGNAITPLVVIALISFPTIAITISEGVKTVPVSLKQMLHIFAPGANALLKELIFPYLKPFLISAVKIALVLGIKASVVAEFFGASNGIGFQIQVAYQSWLVRKLFAWGIIFIVLILLIDFLLEHWEKLVLQPRVFSDIARQRFLQSIEATGPALRTWLTRQKHGESILLEDVSFHYPLKADLINSLNFRLAEDELAILSGESGVGKTTILMIIAGLLKPQRGSARQHNQLGFVFQDDRFLPWRTNLWNVALPILYRSKDKKTALALAY